LLTESLLLSLLAGAAGVLLSLWLADLLEKLLPPLNLPMSLSFSLNGEILGFTLGLCVCAAVLVGVAPALYVRRANVHESLKDAGVRSTQLAAHRARGLLVIAEVAVAFVALAGTGLFVQSFRQLRAVDPGFEARHVALAQLHVSAFCRSEEERRAFVFRLAERLRGMPGVERVGYADAIPLALGNHPWSTVQVEGYVPARGEDMRIASNEVGPGFLAALRIPLLEGRDITESDTELTPPVIVVNQAFNRRFFDGRSPVGRHVRMRGRTFTVVGMAADTRFAALTGAPKPYFYYSYRQVGGAHMWIAFFVRTRGTPAGTIPALRREIARINPQAAVAEIMPYSEYIEGAWYAQKVAATLLSGIGASCLLLAAVGIYSVLSFSVTQRRREFAIRMAMGARQRNVVMLVLRQSFRLVGAGVLSGVALALVAARTAAPLLVGVTLNDPRILGGAVALLCAVALLAVWMPVRAATRVDPMHALRQE
jgi:predicted permease